MGGTTKGVEERGGGVGGTIAAGLGPGFRLVDVILVGGRLDGQRGEALEETLACRVRGRVGRCGGGWREHELHITCSIEQHKIYFDFFGALRGSALIQDSAMPNRRSSSLERSGGEDATGTVCRGTRQPRSGSAVLYLLSVRYINAVARGAESHRTRVRPTTPATASRPPSRVRQVMRSPSRKWAKGMTTSGVVATMGSTMPVGAAESAHW